MLPAYISSAIQSFTHPINLYDLVLKHRQFVMLFGFIFNFLLIFRFGVPAFLFFLFFELSKFYIFGDRFLGEGLAVYPLAYLFFVSFKKLYEQKNKNFDLIVSAVFSWLVIFLRETFAPISIVLFLFILYPYKQSLRPLSLEQSLRPSGLKKLSKVKVLSIILFLSLSMISLLTVNFKDYFFSLITVNKNFYSQNPSYLINSLFYPVYIITSSKWNIFRILLIGIDVLFMSSFIYLLIKRKFRMLLIFVPLFLANIRVVEPGKLFYESFHMVPFYGIFLSSTFLIVCEIKKHNIRFWALSMIFTLFILSNYLVSRNVFFKEKANPYEEFFTNYSNILHTGEVIKKISGTKDTLFVDGYDEEIYWVANRSSSYKYSMYTSFMPEFPVYRDERINMFSKNPPDFYFGSCPKETNPQRLMPNESTPLYTRLNSFGKPSCVFVKNTKLSNITDSQWRSVKEFGFEIPR